MQGWEEHGACSGADELGTTEMLWVPALVAA